MFNEIAYFAGSFLITLLGIVLMVREDWRIGLVNWYPILFIVGGIAWMIQIFLNQNSVLPEEKKTKKLVKMGAGKNEQIKNIESKVFLESIDSSSDDILSDELNKWARTGK